MRPANAEASRAQIQSTLPMAGKTTQIMASCLRRPPPTAAGVSVTIQEVTLTAVEKAIDDPKMNIIEPRNIIFTTYVRETNYSTKKLRGIARPNVHANTQQHAEHQARFAAWKAPR